jgi:hypothetical protein
MYQHTNYLCTSDCVEERKLFVVALGMQIAAMSVLTSIGFSWDYITSLQNYVLLNSCVHIYHKLVHFIPLNTAEIMSRLSAVALFKILVLF